MALRAEDKVERLLKLIARAEPRLRNALFNAVMATRKALDLDELAALIEAGDYDGALQAAARSGAVSLADEYASVYALTGKSTAAFLEDVLDVTVRFDGVNVRAVEYLQTERLRFIREFTNDQRAATRAALVDAMERGINPRETARVFRDSIGLTERQQLAVLRYRQLLESGSLEALDRRLRDGRFDRTVRRAIKEGKPLTKDQVDLMVTRYGQRYVKYRSEVIGRTEALRAVHAASDEAYRQAVEDGHIRVDQLKRKWVTAKDERVRKSHARLNGLVRGMDESWPADEGAIRFPGDPEAPASETIQCRCALSTRINDDEL